jgi:hypothetical protein
LIGMQNLSPERLRQNLSPEGLRIVADVAQRHGVSVDAAVALLGALAQGNGRQAQFNHPDLGGMGQWSEGGMIMVGDMFNQGLKHRVDALCNELAGLLHSQPLLGAVGQAQSQTQGGSGVSLFVAGSPSASQWWPAELGSPASTGGQNDLRYAFFPGPRRLAIQQDGRVRVYDIGEHRLSGFSQQQGGDQSLTFTSQFGLVRVDDLPLVQGDQPQDQAPPASAAPPPRTPEAAPSVATVAAPAATPVATLAADDILKTIERLAELRRKDILTEEEFAAKKADLLARL